MTFETIRYEVTDHVATITLDRPDKLNSFNATMVAEFSEVWRTVREDDEVHVVVLRAAGDKAFCTGVDVAEGLDLHENVWSQDDPGRGLSPRANKVWKPVIAAVHGMVAGGAFYWLNDCDFIVSADDAMFFDPHVSYGMTSALEPIGLARRVPLGEAMRWALVGLDERMSADRAFTIGLVSELVPSSELWSRVDALARTIAAKPPAAVQGTVKAVWETLDMERNAAYAVAWNYTVVGNPIGTAQVSRGGFVKPKWTLR
ncbi:enoyl-CoA hydratase/isomerase family protein [Gordonia liuliyuniae]|uniref:Enoyl-CoA hydratase/isomerase family protein n=1 Tax=Gordonia liuliyuniae TaxID=2911517 RepID=A0ABS9IP47_9ACTN|nr:enoyl-CoA hydratase/isomerase family protein [Gordonia liuliyuniae]MCF8587315.1 enoyl-CoA hydratase/isomerase family protein [Gordonia liuliyuniae]